MARLVVVVSYPTGPRVWVAGQRTHHGATGCAIAIAGALARKPVVVAAGLLLAAHDRADVRVWFKREALPCP